MPDTLMDRSEAPGALWKTLAQSPYILNVLFIVVVQHRINGGLIWGDSTLDHSRYLGVWISRNQKNKLKIGVQPRLEFVYVLPHLCGGQTQSKE